MTKTDGKARFSNDERMSECRWNGSVVLPTTLRLFIWSILTEEAVSVTEKNYFQLWEKQSEQIYAEQVGTFMY